MLFSKCGFLEICFRNKQNIWPCSVQNTIYSILISCFYCRTVKSNHALSVVQLYGISALPWFGYRHEAAGWVLKMVITLLLPVTNFWLIQNHGFQLSQKHTHTHTITEGDKRESRAEYDEYDLVKRTTTASDLNKISQQDQHRMNKSLQRKTTWGQTLFVERTNLQSMKNSGYLWLSCWLSVDFNL